MLREEDGAGRPDAMANSDEPIDSRVIFAAERTFLAWVRTGLALMGFGFVVARFAIFLREVTATTGAAPTEAGFSRWFGVALIAMGVALTAGSTAQHVLVLRRLARGEGVDPRPTWLALALAGFLVVIGLVATVYLATHGR